MIEVVITLVVLGFVFYLVDTYIPMKEPFKTVFYAVVVFVLILWVLEAFLGIGPGLRLR